MKRSYWLPVLLMCGLIVVGCSKSSGGEKAGSDAGSEAGKVPQGDAAEDAPAQDATADQAVTPPTDGEADAENNAEAGLTCTCSKQDQCCDGCSPINEAKSCKSDSLDCTKDLCRQGECAHELKSSV